MTDIGFLGVYGQVSGINASGQIVGHSDVFQLPGGFQGFLTGPNGAGLTPVAATYGPGGSNATGLNDAGSVVGYYNPGTNLDRAFVTGANGVGLTDLGTLGGLQSAAYGINASGQIAGEADTITGERHAFITGPNGVGMTDLGTLGGVSSNASYWAGINVLGQVVGWSRTSSNEQHAFLTGSNGVGMTDLGTLAGGDRSAAWGVTSSGQVVGWSDTAGPETHAFITGVNGSGMLDLNSLVSLANNSYLTEAHAINNRGQILASDAMGHSYLLTPVPDSGCTVLLLAPIALMIAGRSRRRADYQ